MDERLVLPLGRMPTLLNLVPLISTSQETYSSAVAFSSMLCQSASSIRMLTEIGSLVSKSFVSYSIVTPVPPAASARPPAKPCASAHRQTASAISSAARRVACLCAIILVSSRQAM